MDVPLDSSFYLTLRSSNSKEYYVDNIPGSFSNKLCRQLSVGHGNYYCGVSQFHYNPKNVPFKYICFRKEEDKKITVVRKEEIMGLSRVKIKENIAKPLESLTPSLSEIGITLEVTGFETKDREERFKLTITDKNERNIRLEIPTNYAIAFGFDVSDFNSGQIYQTTRNISYDLFNLIENGTELRFVIYGVTTTIIDAQEPREYSFQGLLSEINRCLDSYHSSLYYKEETIKLNADTKYAKTLYVQLSVRMLSLLVVAQGTIFNGDSIYPALGEIRWISKPKYHLIQTSITESQIFGSTSFPLIRMLTIPNLVVGEAGSFIFCPVQYISVETKEISEIKIRITDEYNQPAILTDEETIIQLHFKLK